MENLTAEKLLPPPVLRWDKPFGENLLSDYNLNFFKDCTKLLIGYMGLIRTNINVIKHYLRMDPQNPRRFQQFILQAARENLVNFKACVPIKQVSDSIIKYCWNHFRETHMGTINCYRETLGHLKNLKDYNDKVLDKFGRINQENIPNSGKQMGQQPQSSGQVSGQGQGQRFVQPLGQGFVQSSGQAPGQSTNFVQSSVQGFVQPSGQSLGQGFTVASGPPPYPDWEQRSTSGTSSDQEFGQILSPQDQGFGLSF